MVVDKPGKVDDVNRTDVEAVSFLALVGKENNGQENNLDLNTTVLKININKVVQTVINVVLSEGLEDFEENVKIYPEVKDIDTAKKTENLNLNFQGNLLNV